MLCCVSDLNLCAYHAVNYAYHRIPLTPHHSRISRTSYIVNLHMRIRILGTLMQGAGRCAVSNVWGRGIAWYLGRFTEHICSNGCEGLLDLMWAVWRKGRVDLHVPEINIILLVCWNALKSSDTLARAKGTLAIYYTTSRPRKMQQKVERSADHSNLDGYAHPELPLAQSNPRSPHRTSGAPALSAQRHGMVSLP